jgi:probable HAF family extracellular repeat protein
MSSIKTASVLAIAIGTPLGFLRVANAQFPLSSDIGSVLPRQPIVLPDGFRFPDSRLPKHTGITISFDHEDSVLLPHWTGGFTSNDEKYPYMMVGTDPAKGSATTTINTLLIPVRFVLPDGSVIDAGQDHVAPANTSVVGNVLRSPLFQQMDHSVAGVNVGHTQLADAQQRANFWNIVSTSAPDYHILLNPSVAPTLTLNVPADKLSWITFRSTGKTVPMIDVIWLDTNVRQYIDQARIPGDMLPIFLMLNNITSFEGQPYATGYHSIFFSLEAPHDPRLFGTYIVSTYFDAGIWSYPDINTLSHEIAEWMNDPFVANLAPPWVYVRYSYVCGGNYLEVGDPAETYPAPPITIDGLAYHPQDIIFLSWFARQIPSLAAGGAYSFRNLVLTPSDSCVDDSGFTFSVLDVPGASATSAYSINNLGQVVGAYTDAGGKNHGFLLSNGAYSTLDVPGATGTVARRINDSGQVAGWFFDAVGAVHGFLYINGGFTTLDFPGSTFTLALGIDKKGNIVGSYGDAGFRSHSFLISNGIFQSVNTSSFAVESQLEQINGGGQMVGDYDTGDSSQNFGFVGRTGTFSQLAFPSFPDQTSPEGINTHGDTTGTYFNGFAPSGFINRGQDFRRIRYLELVGQTIYPFQTALRDVNDQGVVAGSFVDFNGQHGMIGTPGR